MPTARRVLIVEDDQKLRTMLVKYLRGSGYTVDEAEDGAKGLACMQANPPDAVILDVQMPEMDGPSFLRTARGDPRLAAVPVVVYSGSPTDQQTAQELGARAYLMKPVDLDVLRAVLDRLTTA
jgi:two-component system, chemotaxis family, chemotaxis protein CheY